MLERRKKKMIKFINNHKAAILTGDPTVDLGFDEYDIIEEGNEMDNLSPSITYPLYAIIYNWKGLKEENYLYTAEELKKFDPELYEKCEDYPYSWHDSTLADCPWKTWIGIRIKNETELSQFLKGCYNEKPDEDDEDNEGWYWENMEDNDLYGYPSNTMRKALAELKGGAK
jgi:hypothetical protein